ncbi:MAG TPA: TonB-dependent receptor [Terriglobales bacterium]|nr:TonB-dependent receptor [Terriglobales bacterium]
MRFPRTILPFACVACVVLFAVFAAAQSPNGNINGLVLDPTSRVIVGADIIAVNDLTNLQFGTKTNNEGVYVLPNLPPGPYRLQVSKVGFKTIIRPDIVLNVQDALSINFTLPIGATLETVTVQGGVPLINTENASVSTVVDRQFAENVPMNGRSFQTLIELTPGVTAVSTNSADSGQFSINGQRASSNYWMVDGVSANVGISASPGGFGPGNGLGGTLGSFSVLGGTNSLVSVDAMQEFRIQTSTYAPEFGRTPGGQISIVTRSGTNQFHGTAFDYFRNDVLDASNWFNGYLNNPPLPKAEERQNDFGGTFSGPIYKNKTFFFFSYEGLRLRLPQTTLTTVPDTNPDDPFSRQFATPAMQPFLAAFPLPNGPEVLDPNGNHQGIAQFNKSYSNAASLDAYSIRVDHRLFDKVTLFARYNSSPSSLSQRGADALSVINHERITTKTATVGATWSFSPIIANDFRVNYSRTNGSSSYQLDNFGGAVPLDTLPFPDPFNSKNGELLFSITPLQNGVLQVGKSEQNLQRQFNVVDNVVTQIGSHGLKFGVDFRRLTPFVSPELYQQFVFLFSLSGAQIGDGLGLIQPNTNETLLFHNLGLFAQDTWRATPHLTLTYGLRWDVDFAPSSSSGPSLPAVTGYNLADFSQLTVAPAGTPAFRTPYANLAPRFGIAYEFVQNQKWQGVLRGGFGVFYDLVSSETGQALGVGTGTPPFGAQGLVLGPSFGGTALFPYTADDAAPPPIPATGSISQLFAFNPKLRLPYTLEWNASWQQALGKEQSLTVSYVGAAGRRLLQTSHFVSPPSNPNVNAYFVDNTGSSDYDALQLSFQRRLSGGLQMLASYSWAHSIDTGSAGSYLGTASNAGIGSNSNANRGPSGFDIRHAFSAGITYDIPTPKTHRLAKLLLGGWSTENFLLARSAPPVDLTDFHIYGNTLSTGALANVRPDLVPNEPLYLYGPQFPGGKAFNSSAFTDPPVDPITQQPLRQGNVPRNLLRGFGAVQWDFAVHRDFVLHEAARLEFRAELFNVLNHPNFGQPNGFFGTGQFGLSTQMLGQDLNGGSLGGGGLSSLYQFGGPRSIQLALKLFF